jgi:hypothetical protein
MRLPMSAAPQSKGRGIEKTRFGVGRIYKKENCLSREDPVFVCGLFSADSGDFKGGGGRGVCNDLAAPASRF